ncbi:hypothetical protein BX600DRAFT_464478 [Xylariales sp. PMI_506]|nr:hypothetical protein BX600DRAFT_464478 [Xylariales sp. PMI_506]
MVLELEINSTAPSNLSSLSPPLYDDVQEAGSRAQLPTSELPSFVLDGKHVFPPNPPARALYELSFPPTEARVQGYVVEKIRYKLLSTDGEGQIKIRSDPIYEFKPFWFAPVRKHVVIEGQSKRRQYSAVMTAVWTPFSKLSVGWTADANGEHVYKTKQHLMNRFKPDADIEWLDKDDRVVGIERRAKRTKEGIVERLPRLDVTVNDLSEKDLDFLVTVWLVRIWKESTKEKEEREDPMNFAKFKRIIESGPSHAKGSAFGAPYTRGL